MAGLKERCLLLWEAASHRKLLLTIGFVVCFVLGTIDQLKEFGRKAISDWVALSAPPPGGSVMILGSPSWLWGVALFFFFLFLWMLETALKFKRALVPNIDVLFNPDVEGI